MGKPLPLFPNSLDPKIERILTSLCEDILPDQVQVLVDQIRSHIQETHQALSQNEFLDVATAECIAGVLAGLLDQLGSIPVSKHRLVVGAARYFVQEKDYHSDLETLLGFDDDVAVLNYVVVEIGRKDLRIEL